MNGCIVITGSGSGVGTFIAVELMARGHPVVLVDRDSGALERTAATLRGRSDAGVDTVVADLTDLNRVRSVAEALARRDDLVGLVNNAGSWSTGPQYPDAAPDAWLGALTLDLLAPMLLTQLLWSTLASASGAVVNIGSSGGIGDAAYGSPEYGAAKAGLRRLTASLGGRDDVRVMAVVPGWIGLDRAHAEWAALSAELRREIGPLIPPERIATEVADLIERGRAGEIVEVLRGDADA